MKRFSTSAGELQQGSNKKVRFSEDTMKDITFLPDNIPENHYHLGQNNYAVVSDFADVVRIHLRRYEYDFSGRLKATKRGVSLSPAVWQGFASTLNSVNFPMNSADILIVEDSVMLSTVCKNGEQYISIQRFFQKRDFSRKFIPSICLLSEHEFKELIRIHKIVTSSVISVMYERVYRRLLMQEVKNRTPTTVIQGDDNAEEEEIILTTSMTELLKDYLEVGIADVFQCNGCYAGHENQLGHECITYNHDYRVSIYRERALLKIDLNNFVRDFMERNIQLSNSITENFINSLNMSNLIQAAVDLYIASDLDPMRVF